ncbi:MAG: CHRD domain-containing protein [Acidimicrobiales bacterium]
MTAVISHRLLPALVTLGALTLAACGSGEDPALEVPDASTTSTTTTTAVPGGDAGGSGGTVTIDNVELTASAEVPGPGDDNGDGFANVFLETAKGEVCYDITVNGIGEAKAAHIHEGSKDVAGDVVLKLEPPAEGSIDACIPDQAELITKIQANPGDFYVNVHSAEFPDGALRGQLS